MHSRAAVRNRARGSRNRPRVIQAFRSELIKLKRPTVIVGVFGILVAFGVLATVLAFSNVSRASELEELLPDLKLLTRAVLESPNGAARLLTDTSNFGGVVVTALFAGSFSAEFSAGTIRNLLVRFPHRTKLLYGKFLALLDLVFMGRLTAMVCSVLLAAALGPVFNIGVAAWFTSEGISAMSSAILNILLATIVWACLGTVSALIFRSPATAISVALAYLLPVENLINSYWEEAARWLPGLLLRAVAFGGNEYSAFDRALLMSAGYAAICLIASMILMRDRDIVA